MGCRGSYGCKHHLLAYEEELDQVVNQQAVLNNTIQIEDPIRVKDDASRMGWPSPIPMPKLTLPVVVGE